MPGRGVDQEGPRVALTPLARPPVARASRDGGGSGADAARLARRGQLALRRAGDRRDVRRPLRLEHPGHVARVLDAAPGRAPVRRARRRATGREGPRRRLGHRQVLHPRRRSPRRVASRASSSTRPRRARAHRREGARRDPGVPRRVLHRARPRRLRRVLLLQPVRGERVAAALSPRAERAARPRYVRGKRRRSPGVHARGAGRDARRHVQRPRRAGILDGYELQKFARSSDVSSSSGSRQPRRKRLRPDAGHRRARHLRELVSRRSTRRQSLRVRDREGSASEEQLHILRLHRSQSHAGSYWSEGW